MDKLFILHLALFFSPISVVHGRSVHLIVKRSPQLSLTVLEDPSTTPRGHPPSPEDLEARRQALINALDPGSLLSGVGGQVQGITDLGLDLVGGTLRNTAQVFAPLTNATRNAKQVFPRVGTVLNRLGDSARSYTRQVAGGLRQTASVTVNNAIRAFTTATARGSEVLGGVFKLVRTLLDNLTVVISGLVNKVSRGFQNVTRVGTQFIETNFKRARNFLESPRLIQPAKDVISIGTNLAKGLASDFTQAQTWVGEEVKSKLSLGNSLIPRVQIGAILSPELELQSEIPEEDGGYNKKRESTDGDSSKSSESKSEIPSDILELLASSNTETKTNSPKSVLEELIKSNLATDSSNAAEASTALATEKTSSSTESISTTSTSTSTTTPASTTSTSTSTSTTTTTEAPTTPASTSSTSTSTSTTTTTTEASTTPASTSSTTTTTTEAPTTSGSTSSTTTTTTEAPTTSGSTTESKSLSPVEALFGISDKS